MKNHDVAGNAGLVEFDVVNGGIEFAEAADLGAEVVIGKFGDIAALIEAKAGEVVFGGADLPAVDSTLVTFGENGEEIIVNAEGIVDGIEGIEFGEVQKIVDVSEQHTMDSILQSINDSKTIGLDLVGRGLTDHDLSVIQQHLPNNQNISFAYFNDNPMINTRSVVNLCNDPRHSLTFVDFAGCNIDVDLLNAQLEKSSIYQSSLLVCKFGYADDDDDADVDAYAILLPTKAETAFTILSFVEKNSFDISNPEHRQTLVHFLQSPKAQKTLKDYYENILHSFDPLHDWNTFFEGLKRLQASVDDIAEDVVVTGDSE